MRDVDLRRKILMKFKTIAVVLAALGMATIAYKYFENDFDLSFGLEEEDEDV